MQVYIIIKFLGDPDVWESGLFDKDSFTEVLGGWAQTVICGRARYCLLYLIIEGRCIVWV